MGRFLSTWAVLVTAILWAQPSRAEILELRRPLAPPPSVPERPAFEELLSTFADPDRALRGGFTVPLAVAIRARGWAFVPTERFEQREALGSLSDPLRDLTMSELPAGRQLVSLLALGENGEQVKIRDLGPRLSAADGRLQQGLNWTLDFFRISKPVAVASAGAAALAMLYQFGTAPATGLGIPVSLSGTLIKNRLNTSLLLNSEPRFKNVRADISARVQLPELTLKHMHLDQVEVGGAAQRTDEGMKLDTRWANIRGRVSWLELCLGTHSSHGDPALWTVLETGVQRDRFSLRAMISRQWQTTHSRLTATATLRTGQVLSGLFLGNQDNGPLNNQNHTFGVVSTGVF